MTASLPERLRHATFLLSQIHNSEAVDAQTACAEVAARIVQLEEALRAFLRGDEDAAEQARELLGEVDDQDVRRIAELLFELRGADDALLYVTQRIAKLESEDDERGAELWSRVRDRLRVLAIWNERDD